MWMLNKYETARQWLQTDPLRHLVHLKYLHLYADLEVYAEPQGVLLMHMPTLTSWDRRQYPNARQILLPTAADETTALELRAYAVQRFPPGAGLALKFCDRVTQQVFAEAYPMRSVRTLISYTAPSGSTFPQSDKVAITSTPDEMLIALLQMNGYARDGIDQAFADGAQAVSISMEGEPVCGCFIYRNFENIWEIGGVRTLEHAQRRGLARLVVETALHTLQKQGRIPRYQVDSKNAPSIHLAESIGLVKCLEFEHYLSE